MAMPAAAQSRPTPLASPGTGPPPGKSAAPSPPATLDARIKALAADPEDGGGHEHCTRAP